MKQPEFTDEELNLIGIALEKVDPTGIIAVAQAAKAKIREYAEGLAAEQVEKAAKAAVGED